MAENTIGHRWLAKIRRLGLLFLVLRFCKRASRQVFFSILRKFPASWLRLGSAKGLYSEQEILRMGRVPGTVLLSGQTTPPIGPESLCIRAALGQEGHQPWPIFWTHHSPARLVGSTLALMNDDKQVAVESVYGIHAPSDPACNTAWLPAAKFLPGNWTSVISQWCCRDTSFNYYHWLLDGLPRLASLPHFPPDTRILVPNALPPYAWDTLHVLGLQEHVRESDDTHLILEHYYFSSPTAMTGCANPHAVHFLRTSFLHLADATYAGQDKFYILRKGKTRGLLREESLLPILHLRGWGIIDLEELSFFQQIQLFSKARAICGVHGAGFTNLVWCQRGCIAMELFAESFLNGCYETLALCVGVIHQFRVFPADEAFCIQIAPAEFELLLRQIESAGTQIITGNR